MSERTVGAPSARPSAAAAFPGATAVTVLDVYDWVAPDGLPGGSAHVHLASTEGYVVIGGAGRLQTLGQRGYAETPLRPGDCLWFTPGTIHRLVNDGQLRLLVVMQNAGLPEHGDAVLTFPPEILADPAAYARAATLSSAGPAEAPGERAGGQPEDSGGESRGERDAGGHGGLDGSAEEGSADADADPALAAAARRRASLAVEGYLALRERVTAAGPEALEDFYAAALRLTGQRTGDWLTRWRAGALATAELTGTHLAEIGAQVPGHLELASLWRIERPPAARGYGMCGRLTTYPASQAVRVG
jgi:mannose-6-phosphate isomerase-like protein (cupin superfamily)